jgi:hypothetical protein
MNKAKEPNEEEVVTLTGVFLTPEEVEERGASSH